MAKDKICLFGIDPQVDFCDQDIGRLAVPGANEDMVRVGNMIKKYGKDIDEIQMTMDSHYLLHVAHSRCWVDKNGKHPKPLFLHDGNNVPTPITLDMVKAGEWRAFNSAWQGRYEAYLEALEKGGRYALMIWPDHCIIGHPGQCLYGPFLEAVTEWENKYFAMAQRTTKGSNPFTEHYSAVKADVEDPKDPKTRLNAKLIDLLKEYDIILGVGEALSHCFANTMRDIFNEFSADQIKKFVLLEDACSSVPGCEQMGQDFIDEYVAKGMQVATTTTFF